MWRCVSCRLGVPSSQRSVSGDFLRSYFSKLFSTESIMALLVDALVEIQEEVVAGDNENSDWEEVEADDAELDKDLMYSAGVTSSGRPSHKHLEAIAKAFNKVNFNDPFHPNSISRKHLLKVIQYLYPKKEPDAGSRECYSNGTRSVRILVDV